MASIAALSAVNRTSRRFKRIFGTALFYPEFLLVTGLAIVGILQVTPWYEPHFIPLLGMVMETR